MMRIVCYISVLIISFNISAQAVLRICSYNLLNFPNSQGTERIEYFVTVLDSISPDILVCQEMMSSAGADQFLQGVLDAAIWVRADYVTIGDSDAMLYFKPDQFELLDIHTIETDLRNFEVYELNYIAGDLRPLVYIATTHLKASQGTVEEQRRLSEVLDFIAWIDANDLRDSNLLLCGDLNFYYSAEPGYQALLADSLFIDPIDTPGYWHNSSQYADVHTQSPRITQFGGGAPGGMDDRFDFALATPLWIDGDEWEYQEGSYTSFGNDGQHFNGAINTMPNYAVSEEVANALHEASDHLPVFIDIDYTASGIELTSPVNLTDGFSLSLFPAVFNSQATLLLNLPAADNVNVTVYNITGRQITMLADGRFSRGSHRINFNASGLPGGIYFIQVATSGNVYEVLKAVLLK
ncbi:hypothetical protein CEE37_07105 [candidate division LCP-89 bacterium B3_LCP]|uniref:Uncharacterized protein n=1 Tax=candidate division LCP-89 bacterium B3_LCP TaxID=2012998 RepID=A0A532V0I3_UNCL8|nr:MAG: hypothetical protein CEE37_07105 [candidate division LCP-89 bacterium B3_LCP]